MPSHHTPPSGVSATLVKIVFLASAAIAFGLVFIDVPGATPKKPASGLMARKLARRVRLNPCNVVADRPDLPAFKSCGRNQHGEVRLAAGAGESRGHVCLFTFRTSAPRISMCSAIQPSSRAMVEAMRSAKHFLPSSALPP